MELDWRVIVCAIVNFVVLVAVLTKFLYKPVLRMLDQRRENIDSAMEEADQARALAAGTEERLREESAQARQKASAMLAETRARCETERQDLLAKAKEEAERLSRLEAEKRQQEQEQAMQDVKAQAAALVIAATERLLSQGLTEEQQNALMDQYIREAGEPV